MNILFTKADKISVKNYDSLKDNKEEIICEDCLKRRNSIEEKEIEQLEKEVKELEERIKIVDQDTEIMEKKTSQNELDLMNKAEIEILKQISCFENEQENKKREINDLVELVLNLEKEEEKFWEEINSYEQELYQLEEKKSVYDKMVCNLESEIARLNEINVLNDVFKISALDEVGTINGLRIGKLKSEGNVNWEETNAGLGHLVHFFAFLLEKFKGFKFRKLDAFEINGSFSKIKGKIGDSIDTYEMFF